MKAKEILIATVIASITAIFIHFASAIAMPRGKVMLNQDGLEKAGALTIEQYQSFINQNQRDATFLEEVVYHTDLEVIFHHIPSITVNFALVLSALLLFRFLMKKGDSLEQT